MAKIADLKKIIDIEGVSQYMLLGPGGQILAHNMENHIIMSSMILSCASICKFIQAGTFHYFVFAQEDSRDFFIFPVGKHYLGIFKKAESQAQDLPQNISSFIRKLAEL